MNKRHSRTHSGFTLIELLIVVAIVAILAAIAVPSYQRYVQDARRADAEAGLMQLAQFMERYYTENNRYSTAAGNAPTLPFTQSPSNGTASYDFDLSAVDTDSFTLRATPTGPQSGDRCGNLTLTHTGVKGAGSSPVEDCWK